MNNEIDFYLYGKEYTNETLLEIAKKTKEIKEKYGYGAKVEFEVGAASAISDYAFGTLRYNKLKTR